MNSSKYCSLSSKRLSRRSFLRKVPGTAAGLLALSSMPGKLFSSPLDIGPRTGLPNPYVTPDSKPLLVCVEGTDFQRMLGKALDILGGLQKLVGPEQNVLIKPNFNEACPYPGISSPSCVRALVCEAVKVTIGAVTVADEGFRSTANTYNYLNLEHPVTSAGGSLEFLEDWYAVRCDHWTMAVPDHLVYQKVYDADVIINTCTLKRHFIASMTCALKNNVGTVTGQNATGTRGYLHGLGSGTAGFHSEVAEIAGLINPELNVVDARAILTVSGPVTSAGVVENVGKIVVCGDMVATDLYCSQLMASHDSSFDPASLNTLIAHAVDLGLGVSSLEDVKIIETTET